MHFSVALDGYEGLTDSYAIITYMDYNDYNTNNPL